MVEIIPRDWWGAKPPKSTPVQIAVPTPKLYLHHAAGAVLPGDDSVSDLDLQRIRSIQSYHQVNRGWNDIAYSFLMDPDGYVFEGRGAGIAGGHTKGQNTVSHAICVMGNYDTQKLDEDLLPRIAELVRYGHSEGWWPDQFTGGHRDAPLANTSCPGKNLYSQLPTINKTILEDDMPSIEEVRQAIRDETGEAVLGALFGGQVGSSKRKTLAEHVLDIKATVGAIDMGDVSEAELEEQADRIIAAVPAAVLAKLKEKL